MPCGGRFRDDLASRTAVASAYVGDLRMFYFNHFSIPASCVFDPPHSFPFPWSLSPPRDRVCLQFGTPESELLTPFAWRGRAKSGVADENAAESAKWVDTRGLLSKIVDVFMREPTDSLYRFWLASRSGTGYPWALA